MPTGCRGGCFLVAVAGDTHSLFEREPKSLPFAIFRNTARYWMGYGLWQNLVALAKPTTTRQLGTSRMEVFAEVAGTLFLVDSRNCGRLN